MPLITKTFAELNQDSVNRLVSLGYTDAQYEATAVRNILESVDFHLANFYSDLQTNLSGQFISQATGSNLDALGLLLGVTRRTGESDSNLQYRISQALTVTQKANLAAHLDALFALSNIRDVIAIPYTQGAGSITFYLIATSGIADAPTVSLAQSALANISAAGAVSFVKTPTPLYINVTATIATITSSSISSSSLQGIASTAITNYISNLSMGDTLIESKLIQAVLDSSTNISDVNIVSISVTDSNNVTTQLLIGNYVPDFDCELFPGVIVIN